MSTRRLAHALLALALLLTSFGITRPAQAAPPTQSTVTLPFSAANPLILDNDENLDVYTDELLLALASAGRVSLRGLVTSSSLAPFNRHVSAADLERMVRNRETALAAARASGFRNLPPHRRGPAGHLLPPASGRIADTRPLGSPGTDLVIAEARRASPARPLVLVMGGPLTLAADAVLQAPDIRDRLVVAWLGGRLGGMNDYNGWADPWAAYIVLEQLPLLAFGFPVSGQYDPLVEKARLRSDLPASPLRDWMVAKSLPTTSLPGSRDADSPPALALFAPGYVLAAERVAFGGWMPYHDHPVPRYRPDPAGRALLVSVASKPVATAAWWQAMTDPAAWGQPTASPTPLPAGAVRAAREAEAFSAAQGVYATTHVGSLDRGDWVRYDRVSFGAGATSLTLRLAVPDARAGQALHIHLGSPQGPRLGTLITQATGGWNRYTEQTATIQPTSGTHDLVLVAAGTGVANLDRWVLR